MSIVPHLLMLLSAAICTQPDDGVNFTRLYKSGAKSVYTYRQTTHLFQENTLTVDIAQGTQKLLEQGRAQILFHFSNLNTSDQTTLPEDVTISTGPNNLPAGFTPVKGSMGFVTAWLLLASATADKAVKLGDEVPLAWDSGSEFGSCKGTIKILDLTPGKQRMKALIEVTWSAYGQTAGKFSLTSIYDTTDFSLVSSSGKMFLGGDASQPQEMSFTKKES